MELWIRSRNKYILIKPDFIYIEPVSIKEKDGYYIKAKHGINNGYSELTLGHYKTEKRALEVLDEIQQALLDNNIPYTGAVISFNNKIIYEMPEE